MHPTRLEKIVKHLVVLCDFDGTISKSDVTDALLAKFASPDWEEIEDSWQEGLITSRQCMTEQYALVKATEAELDGWLGTVEIDETFLDFVAFCRANGVALTIISDGFDFYIKRILARYGLGDIDLFSNHLEFRDGSIVTEFPHTNDACDTCGNCKTGIFHTVKTPANKVVYIGDGWSDRCVAHESDVIFAKHKLITYCHERGLDYTPYLTFADILTEMRSWKS
jgi:2-hydroxy-3-keto-5-methylthiopentenyl-1-phosphate phosphatase